MQFTNIRQKERHTSRYNTKDIIAYNESNTIFWLLFVLNRTSDRNIKLQRISKNEFSSGQKISVVI